MAILITGCSTGVGRAAAIALARAGLPVLASARTVDTIADLAAEGCRLVELDVSDERSRLTAIDTVGPLDALVNNAGYAQAGPVEEVSLDRLRAQFETNVFGAIRLCQLALPAMRERGRGVIVNVGSAGGLIGVPASAAYDMTKWSLEAMSDALRMEVRRFGVRVSLLEPGGVVSAFAATQAATWPETVGPYEKFRANHHERMRRYTRPGAPGMTTPERVAKVVLRAVTARNPKARYKIGPAARVMPLLYRTLPTPLWDAFMTRLFPMT
jgi:short-subunit dehydrogenase